LILSAKKQKRKIETPSTKILLRHSSSTFSSSAQVCFKNMAVSIIALCCSTLLKISLKYYLCFETYF